MLLKPSAFFAPLAPFALAVALAVPAAAQGTFGTAGGYRAQLREQQGLQRLRPDTSLSTSPDAAIQRLEIDGLVVDQTITKLGRDFYDVFYRVWRPPSDAINFTITVQEQPLPNVGTQVTVLVNDEIAFQSRLQPQLEAIETAAGQAAFLAARQLANRDSGPSGL